jgi:hypothetical protein
MQSRIRKEMSLRKPGFLEKGFYVDISGECMLYAKPVDATVYQSDNFWGEHPDVPRWIVG